MPRVAKKVQDDTTHRIYDALKAAFPGLPDDPDRVVYRYNPVSIRVRVVDPKFDGKETAKREQIVNRALKGIPGDALADITMLLMLTPEEARDPTLLLNLEFDDPTGSRL